PTAYNLVLDGCYCLPLLRQQTPRAHDDSPFLCLSDFVRPLETGIPDRICLFATTVDAELEQRSADDAYERMLVQTLADRLAEATAEKIHEEVRRTLWGYAPDEQLRVADLHAERYQGIRPAVRLSLTARPVGQLPAARLARLIGNRHPAHRERYDA
ncbi:5-methyltetrahydrofolate-homocysteine methyltransferase, partial [gut metagenome]